MAALALLSACAAPAALGAPGELAGIDWMRVDDEDASPHFAHLRFEGERASGSAGCNDFFAAVASEGARLRFSAVGVTRRACAGSGMATERRMLTALERTRAYRLDGGDLVLLDGAGAPVARLIRD